MTAPITPGDLVEALQSFSWRTFGINRGSIYTVTDVLPADARLSHCVHGFDCCGFGLRIKEAPTPRGMWWCSESFRPLGRPASRFIASINQWIAEGAPLEHGEVA